MAQSQIRRKREEPDYWLNKIAPREEGQSAPSKPTAGLESKRTPLSQKNREQMENCLRHCDQFIEFIHAKSVERKNSIEEYELLKRTLDSLTADGIADLPDTEAYRIPLFIGKLRPYQFQGVKWLKLQDSLLCNSILADDMGLGKTVQSIAFICDLIRVNVVGPFLIVVPLSTLYNWKAEFERFAPKIPVILYYGNKNQRKCLTTDFGKMFTFDGSSSKPVVLTTYEVLKKDRSLLMPVQWRLLLLDEGHKMKGKHTQISKVCKEMRSASRLLLTGTPLQNSLDELWNLLNFLMPDMFKEYGFSEYFYNVEAALKAAVGDMEAVQPLVEKIHRIIDPFILRRAKHEVEKQIPLKKVFIVYASLCSLQKNLLKTAVEILRTQLGITSPVVTVPVLGKRRLRSSGGDNVARIERSPRDRWQIVSDSLKSSSINYSTIRHLTNHPLLMSPEEYQDVPLHVIVKSSGKMEVLNQMLTALHHEGGHKVLIFTQFLGMVDILEAYCVHKKYKFCTITGSVLGEDRAEQMKKFSEDPNMFIFLLTTRSGHLGINLVAADTVFIYDSDFNPQCDLQAQDRCHRIGQNKPVLVYRLVARNSIDEVIVKMAADKRRLEKVIIDMGNLTVLKEKKVTVDKHALLKAIAQKNDCVEIGNDNSAALSNDDLKVLLDRSGVEENTVAEAGARGKSNFERM